MKEAYAHALVHLAEKHGAQKAVAEISTLLEKKGRRGILPALRTLLQREALRRAQYPAREVVVAHKDDAKAFSDEHTQVRIDKTIIGGHRVREKDTLHDRSYKSQLLNLYQRALSE